jgi:SAM-dependent methyltransferase
VKPREYEIMYMAEESHWWYQGMAAITGRILDSFFRSGRSLRILDAGCGTGGGMLFLSRYGTVTGIDLSPHSVHYCLKRGWRTLARASVMDLPFPDKTFDLVTSLDILYFEGIDDHRALQESFRVLIPGGRILVRVPAFDWLRGMHDIRVSTRHRYTLPELRSELVKSGFHVDFANYSNTVLFPAVALKRLSEKFISVQKESDITLHAGCLGALFRRSLVLESKLITKCRFPFGISIFALGTKKVCGGMKSKS